MNQNVDRQAHCDRRKSADSLSLVSCIDGGYSLPLLHIGAQGSLGTRGQLAVAAFYNLPDRTTMLSRNVDTILTGAKAYLKYLSPHW